ncbi:MAG: hypothetical protein Q7T10_04175 [Rhodoferax sp.]|uniref:hypothetical protein n=1 Tax=Rhodoferax sp. TaxID=50421 RepID=UPI00271DDA87|nr:hypothetical protein [Rhodoferax sp.]MDO8447984.1 hypothetical protein [Rhodoferax sp.]
MNKKPGTTPKGCATYKATDDVTADLWEAWRRFVDLHNSRQPLSWKGKFSFDESEELGFLAARILDDLCMPAPAKYTGGDPYQREGFLDPGRVGFGDLKRPATLADYLLLNELLIRLMRGVARNQRKLGALREQLQDVDSRMQMRRVLSEISRLATALSAA